MRKDLDFSFVAHPLTKDIATKTSSAAIRQAVKNIVLTEYYKRGFNIEFGTRIRNTLFSLMSTLDQQTLVNGIKQALSNFESDWIVVDSINVTEEGENAIGVKINYYEINNSNIQSAFVKLSQ